MKALLAQLFRREDGQDLLEYALLSAFIGLAGFAVWPLIQLALRAAYQSWDPQPLWVPDDPL